MTIFDFADKHPALCVYAALCLFVCICMAGIALAVSDVLARHGLPAEDRKALAAAIGRLDMAAGMIAHSRVTSKPGAAIRAFEHTLTEAARERLSTDLEKLPLCV